MNTDDKRQLLQDAMNTRAKLFDLEFVLQLRATKATGDTKATFETQIADAQSKSAQLNGQIDQLRAAAAEQWAGNAATLIQTLKASNTRIQRQITSLEKTAQTGSKVAKILALADGVIQLITDVVG